MKFLDIFKSKKVQEVVPQGMVPRVSNNTSLFSFSETDIDKIVKSIAYPCMKFRADALSTVELLFTDTKGNPLKEDNWVVKLFNDPNPYFSQNEILKLIQYWLDINGNAFLYLPKYTFNNPIQIWILNPSKVTINTREGYITGYTYNNGGVIKTFAKDEVIHFRNLVPSNQSEFIGTGTAQMALASILSEKELNQYIYRYLVNDAMPPIVLESPDDPGEDAWQLYQQSWNAKLPNHKLMTLLHSGMKATPLTSGGISGSAISIKDLNEVLLNKISMFFGVPYSKLTGQNTSYSSAIVSDWTFKTDTMKPIIVDVIQKLNNYFIQFDKNLKISYKGFEFYDQEFKLKETQLFLQTGVLTPNEVRQTLGLEPLKTPELPVQTVTTEATVKGTYNLSSEEVTSLTAVFKELEDVILSNLFGKDTDELISDKDISIVLNKYNSSNIAQVVEQLKININNLLTDHKGATVEHIAHLVTKEIQKELSLF